MMPEQSPLTEYDWNLILGRIRSEKCVPFLGAGASLGTKDQPGLPTGGLLAEALAEECTYPGTDRSDLLRIAQYHAMVFDKQRVRDSILEKLRILGLRPGLVHQTIAALPFPHVLTTNFDRLMEQAFQEAGKAPQVGWYGTRGDQRPLSRPTVKEPLVYKLHGTLDEPRSMIVTEDDVVEFLVCLLLGNPLLPPAIKQLFGETSILFIGYGLKDWTIRVLLRSMRSIPADMDSFSIQRRPDEPHLASEWEQTVMYWGKKGSLKCFDMDALAFVDELRRRFDAGQGGP